MQIQINNSGILSTIQDMGRQLYRSEAVPVSGVMDALSARLANMVIGNEMNAAVIECTFTTLSFTTKTPVLMAYAGSAFLQTGNAFLPACQPVFIPANQTVSMGKGTSGCRTYIAIAGGWEVPQILGSRSTYFTGGFGGFKGRALQKGDVLYGRSDLSSLSQRINDSLQGKDIRFAKWSVRPQQFLPLNHTTIRITAGPEMDWFEEDTIHNFLSTSFTVGRQSNRMGYQLEGAVLTRKNTRELLSTAVMPGTIQITNKGEPILLMADCQTTGGYPRMAQVAAVDMPLCGQLQPGDCLSFCRISREEAEVLYLERERQLAALADAIRTKYYL